MKAVLDPEWRDLMEDWQAEEGPAPAAPPLSDEVRRRIRRKAKRQSYGLIGLAVFEILGCAGTVVWLLLDFLEKPGPVRFVGLAGTVVFMAAALAFSFWNRRGTWWPASETTRTFVDLSYERCRRKLRTLRACPWLLAAEMLFIIPWAVWAFLSKPEPPPLADWLLLFGYLAFVTAAVLAWSSWYRRRTLRQMAELEELRRSLGEEGG